MYEDITFYSQSQSPKRTDIKFISSAHILYIKIIYT